MVLSGNEIGFQARGRIPDSSPTLRRKILSKQGLRIESPFGDAQIAVTTVVAPEVAPIYDAVILTCKAYDLDAAIAAAASAVAPTGYELPFLNGVAQSTF